MSQQARQTTTPGDQGDVFIPRMRLPGEEIALPSLVTADAQAAAAMLQANDPEIVDAGPSRTAGLWRAWDRLLSMVRAPITSVRERLFALMARWPAAAAFVAGYQRVMDEAHRQRASLAASGAAFWLIISLFPAMIAVVNVFGLILEPGEVAKAVQGVTGGVLAGSYGQELSRELQEVASNSNRSLSLGLVISIFLSLWSVSAGTAAMTRAIRQAYGLRALTFTELRRRSLAAALVAVIMIGSSRRWWSPRSRSSSDPRRCGWSSCQASSTSSSSCG
jgi:Virulence factor BrkB